MPEITVANATDEQVWPDASFRPSPELRAEIRKVAKTVTADEVAASGLTWSPWYVRFVIAQHRVEDRHKQLAATQKKAKEDAAKTAAAAKYPPAAAWEKPFKYEPLIDGGSEKELRCEEFRKEWYGEGRPVPVFRREVAANAGMTINDGRKLYRMVLATMNESDCLTTFLVREANERIADLEKKIAELEERKVPQYRGTWQDGVAYEEGDMITLGGSCWFCRQTTTGRPSTHHEDWQLAVKAGRDGKDLRA